MYGRTELFNDTLTRLNDNLTSIQSKLSNKSNFDISNTDINVNMCKSIINTFEYCIKMVETIKDLIETEELSRPRNLTITCCHDCIEKRFDDDTNVWYCDLVNCKLIDLNKIPKFCPLPIAGVEQDEKERTE